MTIKPKPPSKVVLLAVVFEGALGLIGWGLAAWRDVPLAARLEPTPNAWLRGAAAALPMFAVLVYVMRSRLQPMVELRTRVEWLVGELFRDVTWFGLAVVSTAAGVG